MIPSPCRCVSAHAPSVSTHVIHYVVPLEWGGEDGPRVVLCPTADHNLHALLNMYVRDGGKPSGNDTKFFSAYIKDLAAEAWKNRPESPSLTLTCCSQQPTLDS